MEYVFNERRKELSPYGLTCQRWRPHLMRKPDRHNEIELNLLLSGTISYLLRGRRFVIRPRRLTIFWALAPHQIVEVVGDAPYYVATIPFTRFLQWRLPAAFQTRILQGDVIEEHSDDHGGYDIAMFERWLRDDLNDDSELQEIVLLELEARVRRLALTNSSKEVEQMEARPIDYTLTSKVEQMAAFVAVNYTEALTVKEIADEVGLHPDYATALFKKSFGITLSNYLLDHRISHAQRMLAVSQAKITEIAFECGFNSLSRFNAAFKKLCGCTPRQYRRSHQLV